MSLPAISRHLKVLERAGLIARRPYPRSFEMNCRNLSKVAPEKVAALAARLTLAAG